MTQTRDFTGKDVDLAIENASLALEIPRESLDYDVISQGASGIFGIVGRKDAKIRVNLPQGPSNQGADYDDIQSIVDEALGQDTRREPAKPARQNRKSPPRFGRRDDQEKNSEKPEKASPSGEFEMPEPVDVTQESIDLGVKTLQKMADLIDGEAQVTAETDRDRLTLRIEGGNPGILIGRKGQTLDAMQFLTDKIINRKSDARVRVRVDIEGYMETRKANLQELAFKMAEKAKKPAVLPP